MPVSSQDNNGNHIKKTRSYTRRRRSPAKKIAAAVIFALLLLVSAALVFLLDFNGIITLPFGLRENVAAPDGSESTDTNTDTSADIDTIENKDTNSTADSGNIIRKTAVAVPYETCEASAPAPFAAAGLPFEITSVYVKEGDAVSAGDIIFSANGPSLSLLCRALEISQSRAGELEAKLDECKNLLGIAESNIVQLTALHTETQSRINGLPISAPISGTVTGIADGETASESRITAEGEILFTVTDRTKIQLTQYFSYAYAPQVFEGAKAFMTVSGIGKLIECRIISVPGTEKKNEDGVACFTAVAEADTPSELLEYDELSSFTASFYLISDRGRQILPAIYGTPEFSGSAYVKAPFDCVISKAISNGDEVKEGDTVLTASAPGLDKSLAETKAFISFEIEKIAFLNSTIKAVESEFALLNQTSAQIKSDIENCVYSAKISGTVIKAPFQGQKIYDSEPFLTVADPDVIAFVFTLTNADAAGVSSGTPVKILNDNGTESSGTVVSVSDESGGFAVTVISEVGKDAPSFGDTAECIITP